MPILINGRCYRTFKGAVAAVAKWKRWGKSKAAKRRASAYVAVVERRQRGTKTLKAACPRGHSGKAKTLPWRRKRRRHTTSHYRRRTPRSRRGARGAARLMGKKFDRMASDIRRLLDTMKPLPTPRRSRRRRRR